MEYLYRGNGHLLLILLSLFFIKLLGLFLISLPRTCKCLQSVDGSIETLKIMKTFETSSLEVFKILSTRFTTATIKI